MQTADKEVEKLADQYRFSAGGISGVGRIDGQLLLQLQREQDAHDKRNHFDIYTRHKMHRLQHYGLHHGKYVGRLARESAEVKPLRQTLADALLICLSASNTMQQNLAHEGLELFDISDPVYVYANYAGLFQDACEKLDHFEDAVSTAKSSNARIIEFLFSYAQLVSIDIIAALRDRRSALSERAFFVKD